MILQIHLKTVQRSVGEGVSCLPSFLAVKIILRNMGVSSACKVCAIEEGRLEFNPWNPCRKPGVITPTYKPSFGVTETGLQRTASHSRLFGKPQASDRL